MSETDPLRDSPFLKACRREPTDVTPIWLMRQAGRYMPEYREVRAKVSFLELCKDPDLATEVTVTAAERLGVDAAILFADILLILEPMGFDLEFAKGEGPVIHNPVRDAGRRRPGPAAGRPRPARLRLPGGPLDPVGPEPGDLPLIGFAGAPFTLACYAIEGGGSRHYEKAKAFMYRDPGAWDALMERLVDATAAYLNAQAAAGAQVLQLFDSWVGNLGPDDYRRFVQPHMRRLFDGLDPGRPGRSTSAPTPARCWNSSATPGATSSASTGGSTWPRPGSGSARTSASRGTSTRPSCFAPIAEIRAPGPARSSTRPRAGPATSSTSATASCPIRPSTTSSPWSTRSTPTADTPPPYLADSNISGGDGLVIVAGGQPWGHDWPPASAMATRRGHAHSDRRPGRQHGARIRIGGTGRSVFEGPEDEVGRGGVTPSRPSLEAIWPRW